MISCPECLRTFPQVLDEAIRAIHETGCVYCHSLIHYAIVQPTGPVSLQAKKQSRIAPASSLSSSDNMRYPNAM